jgi:hypothetical protein
MDIQDNKLSNKNKIFFLFIFIFAILLRIYNYNFEDLWFDEQATFWVAQPNISFYETLERSAELDNGSNLIFNLILKEFFEIFYYDPNLGRAIPILCGSLSIPLLSYLTLQIKKDNSYILVGVLSSLNFYLISYSQELRLYSLLFLISILSIIFFYKIFEDENLSLKKFINSLIYIIFSTLGASVHTFFFIIIFSQLIFLLLNYLIHKKKYLLIFFCIFIILFLYLIFMFEQLLLQISIEDFWIQQVNFDFFINYFFSRFFGSKIMGAIYLLTLIYFIIVNKKILFRINNKLFLLILILFFSYILPLFYSVFQKPILIDRYIIFVLIPIFILISISIINFKENRKKNFFLFFIVLTSSINSYIEIFSREISKPEFNKSFHYILSSNTNNNILIKTKNDIDERLTVNYSMYTDVAQKNSLNFYTSNDNYSTINEIWVVCYKPINDFDCSLNSNLFFNWKKLDSVDYNLINSSLYKR